MKTSKRPVSISKLRRQLATAKTEQERQLIEMLIDEASFRF